MHISTLYRSSDIALGGSLLRHGLTTAATAHALFVLAAALARAFKFSSSAGDFALTALRLNYIPDLVHALR